VAGYHDASLGALDQCRICLRILPVWLIDLYEFAEVTVSGLMCKAVVFLDGHVQRQIT
jgi:hypothetical protein